MFTINFEALSYISSSNEHGLANMLENIICKREPTLKITLRKLEKVIKGFGTAK